MKLELHEVSSSTWHKLKTHYEEVLSKKRERLENPRIAESERIQLAWEIHTIKDFLATGTPERVLADAE